VWEVLSATTARTRIGVGEIRALAAPGLALTVAMHAAQHGGEAVNKPLRDLHRAVRLADERCWREAAALAERIDAMPAFATGLRLDPAGARLADRLDLPKARPLDVALRERPQRRMVMGIEHLATARGARAKARFVVGRTFPPRAYMRRNSALARHGPVGLLLAYAWRPFGMLIALPRAIVARGQARAAERAESSHDRTRDPQKDKLGRRDRG
jgi:hypothetical protein